MGKSVATAVSLRQALRSSPWFVIAVGLHALVIAALSVVYVVQHRETVKEDDTNIGVAQHIPDEAYDAPVAPTFDRTAIPRDAQGELVSHEEDLGCAAAGRHSPPTRRTSTSPSAIRRSCRACPARHPAATRASARGASPASKATPSRASCALVPDSARHGRPGPADAEPHHPDRQERARGPGAGCCATSRPTARGARPRSPTTALRAGPAPARTRTTHRNTTPGSPRSRCWPSWGQGLDGDSQVRHRRRGDGQAASGRRRRASRHQVAGRREGTRRRLHQLPGQPLQRGARRAGLVRGLRLLAQPRAEGLGREHDPLPRSPRRRRARRAPVAGAGATRRAATRSRTTSVTGWVVMALKSAQLSGLAVPREALDGAVDFTRWVTGKDGLVGYLDPSGAGNKVTGHGDQFDYHVGTLSALGMLIRTFTQHDITDPFLQSAAQRLTADLPAVSDDHLSIDYYYWYYGSLALMQYDGPDSPRADHGRYWKPWNEAMIAALTGLQDTNAERDVCSRGGWLVPDRWSHAGGPIYSTALNVLTLEVYYRYPNAFGVRAEPAPRAPGDTAARTALKLSARRAPSARRGAVRRLPAGARTVRIARQHGAPTVRTARADSRWPGRCDPSPAAPGAIQPAARGLAIELDRRRELPVRDADLHVAARTRSLPLLHDGEQLARPGIERPDRETRGLQLGELPRGRGDEHRQRRRRERPPASAQPAPHEQQGRQLGERHEEQRRAIGRVQQAADDVQQDQQQQGQQQACRRTGAAPARPRRALPPDEPASEVHDEQHEQQHRNRAPGREQSQLHQRPFGHGQPGGGVVREGALQQRVRRDRERVHAGDEGRPRHALHRRHEQRGRQRGSGQQQHHTRAEAPRPAQPGRARQRRRRRQEGQARRHAGAEQQRRPQRRAPPRRRAAGHRVQLRQQHDRAPQQQPQRESVAPRRDEQGPAPADWPRAARARAGATSRRRSSAARAGAAR